MSIFHNFRSFTFFTFMAILFIQVNYCICMNLELLNSSFAGGFSPAVATWNGPPNGPGNTGNNN